jgi:hypothetical protein
MKRQQNLTIKAALLSAFIVIGGASSVAMAGGDRGHHRHSDTCGCYTPQYAGSISIDGCTTRIRSDRPMYNQIAKAFRNAGYRVRVIGRRVQVDYGYCRPNVRWYTDRYKARIHWDYSYHELSVSLRKYDSYGDRRRGYRGGVRIARRTIGRGYCD